MNAEQRQTAADLWTKPTDLSQRPSCTACHFLTDNSLLSAGKDQQESRAVAEKPQDAVVKFHTSKFTATLRGPPCDSMASCLSL